METLLYISIVFLFGLVYLAAWDRFISRKG